MNQNFDKTSADLVVYGKIFTSENNQIVEAFAVKDGKYVYVGEHLLKLAKPRWWITPVRVS